MAPTGPLLPQPTSFPPPLPNPAAPPPPILPCLAPPTQPLLPLLQAIPLMPSVTSILFPPQRLAHKFAEHYSTALWNFCQACGNPVATVDEQLEASLLAKWMPLLIMHLPADADTEFANTKHRHLIKHRLQLADLGRWAELVNELLKADAEARTLLEKRSTSRPAVQSTIGKYTAVCRKVLGNCLRSAAQILTGAGQPMPSRQTFDSVRQLFVCVDAPAPDPAVVQLCLDLIRQSPAWHPNLRQLTRRVQALRNGAQPGPSKCRNTHLKACLKARWGPSTLLEWSRLWCTGNVPLHMAAPFLYGWIAPLSKPGGRGIRPIALFECPVKLATGLLMEHTTKDIAAVVSPYQFGIGMPAGAEVMLKTIQAVARAFPDIAFGSSDVKNAFGTVFRRSSLRAVAKFRPVLIPAMAQMWQGGASGLLAQCSPTLWEMFFVGDGVFQGECLSTAIFCLVMHDAILAFYDKIGPELKEVVFVFAYVDDVVIAFPPHHAEKVWGAWKEALAERGLMLEQTKCHAWIPSATSVQPALDAVITQDLRGIPLLGSAAEGEFESFLGPFALHSDPLIKRVDRARSLAAALLEMCVVVLETASRQCIWILLSRLLCHCLDFDARVLSHASLEPFSSILDNLVDSVIVKILPDVALHYIRPQLSLPGHLGGAFLLPACDVVLCAPLASFLQTYPIIHNTLLLLRLSAAIPHIDKTAAYQAMTLFASRGADPSTILQHNIDIQNPGPVSITKAFGRLIGFCAERRFHSIFATSSSREAARLLSCGGPGNGEWLRTPSSTSAQGFTDTQFLTALRWRLGLTTIPLHKYTCCHQYVKPPFRACDHPFDHHGHHAVVCNVGGGPTAFLHNPIADLTASFLTAAGFDARREVSIPEFTSTRTSRSTPGHSEMVDGVVDVLGWHVVLGEFLLDVTVRHPHAVSVLPRSATTAGAAAAAGELDKHLRYPSRGGRSVVPLAIETYGRLGDEFNDWLMTLSSAARARDRMAGLSAGRHLSKWRLALNVALYKGIAKTIEDSYTLCRNPRSPPAYTGSAFVS